MRMEAGKNGSQPSVLLAGFTKTDSWISRTFVFAAFAFFGSVTTGAAWEVRALRSAVSDKAASKRGRDATNVFMRISGTGGLDQGDDFHSEGKLFLLRCILVQIVSRLQIQVLNAHVRELIFEVGDELADVVKIA